MFFLSLSAPMFDPVYITRIESESGHNDWESSPVLDTDSRHWLQKRRICARYTGDLNHNDCWSSEGFDRASQRKGQGRNSPIGRTAGMRSTRSKRKYTDRRHQGGRKSFGLHKPDTVASGFNLHVRFFIPDGYLLCTSSSETSSAHQYNRGEAIIIYVRVGHFALAVCGKKGLARESLMERGQGNGLLSSCTQLKIPFSSKSLLFLI